MDNACSKARNIEPIRLREISTSPTLNMQIDIVFKYGQLLVLIRKISIIDRNLRFCSFVQIGKT